MEQKHEPLVHVSTRIKLADWNRMTALAQERGVTRGGRANVSEAARLAIEQGLQVMAEEANDVTS